MTLRMRPAGRAALWIVLAVSAVLLTSTATALDRKGVEQPKSASIQGLGPLYYMMVLRPGPHWIAGKPYTQQALLPHGHYLQALYDQGKIVLAGPFLDDGGFIILDCATEAEAKTIAANEPATRAGIFVSEIHPIRYAFDRANGRSVWPSAQGRKP
jgi:uncharacterized protein